MATCKIALSNEMLPETDDDVVGLPFGESVSCTTPFIDGFIWQGHATCLDCGCELEEVCRGDENCILLQCHSCGMEHKALEHWEKLLRHPII